MKRAIFDCYKYGCLSSEDYYHAFDDQMRYVDLSVIDNGEFSIRLHKKHSLALAALKRAKAAEHNSVSNTDDKVFDLFEKAYEAYFELRIFIDESLEKAAKARRKQFGAGTIAFIITIVSIIVTIVNTVLPLFIAH